MERMIQNVKIDKEMCPACYDDFHCLMSKCRLNCCNEPWRIVFSKKDYLAMRNLRCSADLKRCLKQAMCRIREDGPFYAKFRMDGGACPLFRKDGLCALQVEKGTCVQPEICRIFPRREQYTRFGYLEHSLTPACEGVLELLWELPGGMEFQVKALPQPQCGELDLFVTRDFCSSDRQGIRSLCIDILQDRRFSLPHRIFRLGIVIRELINDGTDVSRWKQKAANLPADTEADTWFTELKAVQNVQAKSMVNNLNTLLEITIENRSFQKIRQEIVKQIGTLKQVDSRLVLDGNSSSPLELYHSVQTRYYERFGDREYFMENLMVSIFFYLQMPDTQTPETLWRSYVKFCSLYSFYHFMAIMSCRDGAAGNRQDLFELIVHVSRNVLHNDKHMTALPEELFKHENATLADMAVLLSG